MPQALAPEPTAAPPRPATRGRLRRLVRAALAGLLVWLAWNVGYTLLGSNVHAVVPGKVYRGAQHSPAALEQFVRTHGVRTVVNLRGRCELAPWYQEQTKAVQRLGISQEDVCFSAIHLPSRHELRLLLDVLDHAEYPIFFHCRHGADRTGLAAVAYLLLQDGVPYADARRQLGPRYGHVPFSRTGWLDFFFGLYEQWLAARGQEHTPSTFRHWVLNEYRGGPCDAAVEAVEPLDPILRAGKPLGFRVRLHNRSDYAWQFKPTSSAGVHVYFQVWDADGKPVCDGRAGLMDRVVPPGERVEVVAVVPSLPRAGRYRVCFDLIEEFHCWFYQTGTEPWEEELEVRE